MNPRKFLDFFKSKTGKIILFLGLIGIGCILYHGFAPPAKTTKPEAVPNLQGAPEKNQPTSVDRGGSRFIIPGFLSLREPNNGGTNAAPTNAPPVLPISLYNSDDGEAQVSEEYAPYGRLIPCETIITIDSAKIETPIIGFVTEDASRSKRQRSFRVDATRKGSDSFPGTFMPGFETGKRSRR